MIAVRLLSLALVALFFGAASGSPVPGPTHTPKPVVITQGVSIYLSVPEENCGRLTSFFCFFTRMQLSHPTLMVGQV